MTAINVPGVDIATLYPSVGPTVVRGMGQGMRATTNLGGSFKGARSRTGHYCPFPFLRSKVVFGTFHSPSFQDTDFPNPMYFQFAIEPIFQNSRSGWTSTRYLYKFNGASFATYSGPGTNPKLFMESDWLLHPAAGGLLGGVPVKFGLHSYIESVGAAVSLPYTDIGSSYVERFEGAENNTTSLIGTDPVLNATSIANLVTSQGGANQMYTPAFLLLDFGIGIRAIAIEGTSIIWGTGEGGVGSPTDSDTLGSIYRSVGYAARGIFDNLKQVVAVNTGKPSDGVKFKDIAGAFKGRAALIARSNPTHILNENGPNDYGIVGVITSPTAWLANTYYQRGDTKTLGGNVYLVIRGGKTAASGGPTGTGTAIADNEVIWKYMGATTSNQPAAIYGRQMEFADILRLAAPGAMQCKAFGTPFAASTDQFLTLANQTPDAFSGSAYPGTRSQLSAYYFADRTAGVKDVGETWFEPGFAIEDGYDGTVTGMTGKWSVDGTTPYRWTPDGLHPHGRGAKQIGDTMSLSTFPMPV